MAWLTKSGHLRESSKGHPYANGRRYIYVHQRVVELQLGRALTKAEHVHHIDGNKRNNHPDNLEVLSISEHSKVTVAVQSRRQPNGRFISNSLVRFEDLSILGRM